MAINISGIANWFKTTESSLAGYLNTKEMLKILVTALGSGATVWGLLTAFQKDLSNIVLDNAFLNLAQQIVGDLTAKDYASLGFAVIALVGEIWRRTHQGTPTVPVIVPTPSNPVAPTAANPVEVPVNPVVVLKS